jgi:Family of unknown function (DUF5335)
MRNRLVPRSEWFQFFDAFSRRHQGRIATVHVFGPGIGYQTEARSMPLEGVVSNADATGPIAIYLGAAPPGTNIEHEIDEPKQVWVELTDSGAEKALQVESKDGTKTMLELRAARIRPEPVAAGAGQPS